MSKCLLWRLHSWLKEFGSVGGSEHQWTAKSRNRVHNVISMNSIVILTNAFWNSSVPFSKLIASDHVIPNKLETWKTSKSNDVTKWSVISHLEPMFRGNHRRTLATCGKGGKIFCQITQPFLRLQMGHVFCGSAPFQIPPSEHTKWAVESSICRSPLAKWGNIWKPELHLTLMLEPYSDLSPKMDPNGIF